MRDRLRDAELGESVLEAGRIQELIDNTWMEKGEFHVLIIYHGY